MGRGHAVQSMVRESSRVASTAIAILMLAASLSCAPTTTGGTTTGPAPEGDRAMKGDDAPVDDNAGNEDPAARLVGTLPKPLDYYRTHGDEFHDFVKELTWHGHIRYRSCKDCGANERTKLKIQAVSNATADRLTPLPANGLVRGRVINVGDHEDATTRIKATHGLFRKADEYYFIITDDGSRAEATLWVAKVEFSGVFQRPNDTMSIRRARYKYAKCQHEHVGAAPKTHADFRECSDDGRSYFVAHTVANTMLAMPWFPCDGGCCTSNWTDLE